MSQTKRFSPDETGGTEPTDPREYAEWSLEATLENFQRDYGDEALAEQVDRYMTERAIY
jgi:hypothetical protein